MFGRRLFAMLCLMLAAPILQGQSPTNTVLGTGAGANEEMMLVDYNTAIGNDALYQNLFGNANTALGAYALYQTGDANNISAASLDTAVGAFALYYNSQGSDNTAVGFNTLSNNFEGNQNTALGESALYNNWNGNSNVAVGYYAMPSLSGGTNNVAVGTYALRNATGGSGNIAIGYGAGSNISTGAQNILIGNPGTSSDWSAIRIGSSGVQNQAFIAGIRGQTTGQGNAIEVFIDSNGQLGTKSSSRKLKTDINEMGDMTKTLMGLRPVSFRYTSQGPDAPVQYGLIAEEVADVAPELVAHKPDGQIETVFYDKVNTMLLDVVQKQQHTIEELESTLHQVETRLTALEGSEQK
ncbi:MAG: tail fiber domain-containing protein [Terracidiphilus sp.]